MLTKDLLKFTVRGEQIYPKYVAPADKDALAMASALETLFDQGHGEKWADIQQRITEAFPDSSPLQAGFIKLLEDRCEVDLDDEQLVEERRWQILEAAQKLRSEQSFTSPEALQEALSEHLALSPDELTRGLYADLPDQKILQSFKPCGTDGLIHRYNCAQIQGLLLRADALEVELADCNLKQKRRLFQKVKFHRLLVDVMQQEPLRLRISGPAALFDGAQTYGMRLAHFFPYILLLSKWHIEARLRMKGKNLLLKASSKRPIRSHYPDLKGYVPEEYRKFIEIFQQRRQAGRQWKVVAGEDFVHLGRQSYCFPDFAFEDDKGRKMYLELFHRWHRAQLCHRLEALADQTAPPVVIGICNSLKIDDKLNQKLKDYEGSGIRFFKFRGFPSPRAVLAQLPS
jgi:hypothetical protein